MTVINDIKKRFIETELEHWNDIAMLTFQLCIQRSGEL